jgi:hypothetical protein
MEQENLKNMIEWDWKTYFSKLQDQEKVHDLLNLEKRIIHLEKVKELFEEYKHFSDIPADFQQGLVAGVQCGHPTKPKSDFTTVKGKEIENGQFGCLKGAGVFHRKVNHNNKYISLALDIIPSEGEVTKEKYDQFIEILKKAFIGESRGLGVPTASRLLTVKNPEQFFPLNAGNKLLYKEACDISVNTSDFDKYWDVVSKVKTAKWANSRCPIDGSYIERKAWQFRLALLDNIIYTPKDLL